MDWFEIKLFLRILSIAIISIIAFFLAYPYFEAYLISNMPSSWFSSEDGIIAVCGLVTCILLPAVLLIVFKFEIPKGIDDLYLPSSHPDMVISQQKAQAEIQRFIDSFHNSKTHKLVKYTGREKLKHSQTPETVQEWFEVDCITDNEVKLIDHNATGAFRKKPTFSIFLTDIEDWVILDKQNNKVYGGFSKLALYKHYLIEVGEHPKCYQKQLDMQVDIDFKNQSYS